MRHIVDNEIDFSIIMPVHKNIEGFNTCIRAFDLFTDKHENLEMHLIVDDDDDDYDYYCTFNEKVKFDIIVHKHPKTDCFSRDYYNKHFPLTRGNNIMAFNDDCYVQTNKWDKIVLNRIEANKHFNGYYFVDVYDSTRKNEHGVEFPRFPIISRKCCDLLGMFFFDYPRNWPADKVIWDFYSQIGNVISCHDVKLQHDHNFDHVGDKTKSRFMMILQEDIKNGVFPVKCGDKARLLIEAIKSKDMQ